MDKSLFEELVGSLKEAQAIAKGRAKPSRRFELVARELCQAHACERQDAAKLGATQAQPHRTCGGAAQDRGHGARSGVEVLARLS